MVVRSVDSFGYGIAELRQSATDAEVGGTIFDSEVNVVSGSWVFSKVLRNGGAYEYALQLSWGERTTTPAFDAGDARFSHLRCGAGWNVPLEKLGSGTTLRAEVWGQYSGSRLSAIEEFHLGSRESERAMLLPKPAATLASRRVCRSGATHIRTGMC